MVCWAVTESLMSLAVSFPIFPLLIRVSTLLVTTLFAGPFSPEWSPGDLLPSRLCSKGEAEEQGVMQLLGLPCCHALC